MRAVSNDNELHVAVTWTPGKGFVATATDLRTPVVALSLSGVIRRIEALMMPDDVRVRLHLDRLAQRERDQRRRL